MGFHHTINQYSASALEQAANRLVQLDPESAVRLDEFEGKHVQIAILDLKLSYQFLIEKRQIKVSSSAKESPAQENTTPEGAEKPENSKVTSDSKKPNATISGNLSAFVAAASAEHSGDALFKGELYFSGDINTAKQFQQFAQSLNIDWQEPLAQLLGDPVGHTLATGFVHFSNWFGAALTSAQQDMSEYLQEESRVTPSAIEQQHFFDDVDQLRSRGDRLIARAQRMIKHLDSRPDPREANDS